MPPIRILPEILSNKIAAGEVVERPASVVKELVENALDAQATRIIVEVEKGGRALIRVSDNGTGMPHDDALLAIERYATSKIANDSDLFKIATLGFRGEALPSIASVSRFTLVTRDRESDAGVEISIEGGRLKNVTATGAPVGTMVSVRQLFFNTPARRKFLKTVTTEMSHIAETVATMALGRPAVQIRLLHDGRVVKSWSAAADPVERVADVLGRDVKSDLYAVATESEGLRLSGWIAGPRVTRATSRGIYLYINGRAVRDRVLQHALFEGYGGRLMKGQFPVAVLFVEMPSDQVDVNVHPTKNEVRFVRQKQVHDTVAASVSAALAAVDRAKWGVVGSAGRVKPQVAERWAAFRTPAPAPHPNRQTPFDPPDPRLTTGAPAAPRPPSATEPPGAAPVPAPESAQQQLWDRRRFADLEVIGQFKGTYLLCAAGDDLIVIDQHAAHERILYEQLQRQVRASKPAVQPLLVPETFDLGFREAAMLERLIPDLAALGLEVEPFGGRTFVVKAVPVLLGTGEVRPLIVEIVEKMVADGFSAGLDRAIDDCLHLMACHAAVRAHQALSDKEIKHLLAQLDACDQPSHCPHGRPTWIRWSKRFLEKAFGRLA